MDDETRAKLKSYVAKLDAESKEDRRKELEERKLPYAADSDSFNRDGIIPMLLRQDEEILELRKRCTALESTVEGVRRWASKVIVRLRYLESKLPKERPNGRTQAPNQRPQAGNAGRGSQQKAPASARPGSEGNGNRGSTTPGTTGESGSPPS
jgi:hypothetical protein